MANIKQQKKRVGIAARQRLENLRYKSTIRTLFRTLQTHVNAADREAAAETHHQLVRLLDRAASRNALHANTASRKKSRAARLLVAEPVKETKKARPSKKKGPARKPATQKPAAKTSAKPAPDKPTAAAKPAAEKAAAKTPSTEAAAKTKATAKSGTDAKAKAKADAKPKADVKPKAAAKSSDETKSADAGD